jgi:hypothetical protein
LDALIAILAVVLMLFLMALSYKNRVKIAKWVNDPELARDIPRELVLARRIEDAERELRVIQSEKNKQEGG